jgi:anti-sigma factor RsiW
LEEHLAACPECQQKLESEQEFISVIQSEAPRFKPSPFLRARIQATLREEESSSAVSARNPISLAWIFSSLAFAAFCIVVANFFWKYSIPDLDRDAVANHVRSLQVNHLMDVASTDQHTVKPWFAGKLDYSPPVVDLVASGYPLIGGRLDVLDHRNVAAIIYQRRKHYINLFIWPSDTESLQDRLYELDGYHALGWTKSGMNYLAVSELGEKELREFVGMIQDKTAEARPGE